MGYSTVLFTIVSPANACLIIILNIVEVIFICKMKMVDRKKSTVFILNLAISDLFLGFMILVVKILYTIKDELGYGGGKFFPLFCSFMRRSVIQITLMASVLTNNILTTERFLAVKHPYVYNRITKIQRRNACLTVWFISIAIVLCFYFADPHDLLQRYHEQFIILSSIIVLSIPWPIISYTIIRRVLKRRFSKHLASKKESDTIATSPRRLTMFSDGRRFITLCLRSFIIFLVCWLPYAVFGVFIFIHRDFPLVESIWLRPLQFSVHMVAFINSSLNPILYLYTYNFGTLVRRHFKSRRENKLRSTITIRAVKGQGKTSV